MWNTHFRQTGIVRVAKLVIVKFFLDRCATAHIDFAKKGNADIVTGSFKTTHLRSWFQAAILARKKFLASYAAQTFAISVIEHAIFNGAGLAGSNSLAMRAEGVGIVDYNTIGAFTDAVLRKRISLGRKKLVKIIAALILFTHARRSCILQNVAISAF